MNKLVERLIDEAAIDSEARIINGEKYFCDWEYITDFDVNREVCVNVETAEVVEVYFDDDGVIGVTPYIQKDQKFAETAKEYGYTVTTKVIDGIDYLVLSS